MKLLMGSPALFFALTGASVAAAMSVSVTSSVPSPARVGTVVTFNAQADDAGDQLWYRFRIRSQNGDFQTVRDFGPVPTLKWTATAHEGTFDLEITARDLVSGETAQSATFFEFTPIGGAAPVVTPTSHPLVFLYSAPACESHQRMRVDFYDGNGATQSTPFMDCGGG